MATEGALAELDPVASVKAKTVERGNKVLVTPLYGVKGKKDRARALARSWTAAVVVVVEIERERTRD